MTFFEVSPLCNFNVIESFTELSRIVLMRHGMEKFWRPNRGEWTGSRGVRKGPLRQRVEVKQSEQFLECLQKCALTLRSNCLTYWVHVVAVNSHKQASILIMANMQYERIKVGKKTQGIYLYPTTTAHMVSSV